MGDCGVGCVVFQQHFPYEKPDMARIILGCVELQTSTGLRTLELDLPLSVADLESVAVFLNRNQDVSEVVIHLRPAFYFKGAGGFQQTLSKLRELCASERGARVRLVRYRRGARIQREGVNGATETDDNAFLAPVEEEVQSAHRFHRALLILDAVVALFQVVDILLCLAVLLDYLLGLGLLSFMSTTPSGWRSSCSWRESACGPRSWPR